MHTLSEHFHMATVKKIDNNLLVNTNKDVGQLEPSYTAGQTVICYNLVGKLAVS